MIGADPAGGSLAGGPIVYAPLQSDSEVVGFWAALAAGAAVEGTGAGAGAWVPCVGAGTDGVDSGAVGRCGLPAACAAAADGKQAINAASSRT